MALNFPNNPIIGQTYTQLTGLHIENSVVSSDIDYVKFTVGDTPITALYLTYYQSVDNISFFAIQQGDAWTAGQDINQMLIYSHFGPDVPGYTVGSNILSQQNITLQANTTYTMWIQQTGTNLTSYVFSTNQNYTGNLTTAIDYSSNPASPSRLTILNTSSTWEWNGVTWDLVYSVDEPDSPTNQFTTFSADTGLAQATVAEDTLQIVGGTNVTTSISGKTLTINAVAENQEGATDVFKTVVSDDGQATAVGADDTLNILGGTNISTEITTNTKDVRINLDAFSINFLTDVDTFTNPPSAGQVLKWDGARWAPGLDATLGGTGLDAETLNGQLGSYYLNYNNFTNTPTVATLTSFSVGNERTPSGDGAIEYNNTTGVFRYTPPTAAGIGALTTEVNNLNNAVVWANVPNANITQSSVTQHQAAIRITESQITDLRPYLTGIGSLSINALNDVDTVTAAPSNGQVLAWNTSTSNWAPTSVGSSGEANQNAFSNIAVPGSTTVAADTPTDTLTLQGGNGIVITTNAITDTITIESNLITGADRFSQLTDTQSQQLTIDEISENAIVTLRAGANGFIAYTFNSHYSGDNPTIYAISGTTLAIDLNGAPGHPTVIQTAAGVNLTSGVFHVSPQGIVTQQGVTPGYDADRGTVYWRIPESFSGNYRYLCTAHAPMVGIIVVKRLSTL